jgi:hypothetical protein
MEFIIPKIFKKLNFSDYAQEFGAASLDIWVNPPSKMYIKWLNDVRILQELIKDAKGKEAEYEKQFEEVNEAVIAFYAAILHEGGKPLPVDAVKKMFDEAMPTDPNFPTWVVDRIINAIVEHRDTRKN